MTTTDIVGDGNVALSPFRVLGVALVIDQLGKEACMAFRYPTSLNSGTANSAQSASTSPGTQGKRSEELFFNLSSRQMAKLFRPKHSLCGQPMTLSVGGTVFCFRAVLMGEPAESSTNNNNDSGGGGISSSNSIASATTQSSGNSNNNINNNSNNSDHLVLFSVVVALAPQVDTLSSIPISGWFEAAGGDDDKSHDTMNQSLHRPYSSAASMASSDCFGSHGDHNLLEETHRASASFLAIRRVQVSIARLCRVLEREEKRCRYISLQSSRFFKIRADLQKKWEEKAASASTSSRATSSKPPVASGSPKADFSGKGQPPTGGNNKHHRRGHSFSQALLTGGVGSAVDAGKERMSLKNKDTTGTISQISSAATDNNPQEDREQEVLEHVLAAGPQEEDNSSTNTRSSNTNNSSRIADRHHGNLGRELVQVFHALSRNDHNFPPSSSVLSGRDGIVYLNRHLAVAVEAVSLPKTLSSPETMSNTILRPYHTLIFPNASPSQLLHALQSSGFTAPLQQLLSMVRPSKPLTDIAVDSNLPLSVTMELANYMVTHGACVASTVLTRASRLACKRVDRIQDFALDFSQTFDDWSMSLFLIVSFLTMNGRTLGESMTALTTGEDEIGSSLRACILASMFQEDDAENYIFVEDNDASSGASGSGDDEAPGASEDHMKQQQQLLLHPRAEELEEVLYSIAIWLLSHQVLGHIQDYLVLSSNTDVPFLSSGHTTSAPTSLHGGVADIEGDRVVDGNVNNNVDGIGASENSSTFDECLLNELQETGCLIGTASIVAISWRLGLDEAKLRSWATRHDKLRLVSRLAAIGDDWGAV